MRCIVDIVLATTRLGSTSRPIQKAAWSHKTFEHGTWGGEIRREFAPQPGDIVALEHWCSSGFANTDLDVQLKKHGIHQLIVIGLLAHTCVEATVRYAAELGYEVTMVKDATASYSDAGDARRARHQYPELRQGHGDHQCSRRRALCCPNLRQQCAVVVRERSEGMRLSTTPIQVTEPARRARLTHAATRHLTRTGVA